MTLLLLAFIAGVLTVLAPCILPVLPIVIGGSVSDRGTSWKRVALIVGSLGVSVVLFTLLLKATTALLGVPQSVWQILSGGLIVVLGVLYLFPELWEKLSLSSGFALKSQQTLANAKRSGGYVQPVAIGAALGPVFSSCSPTYAFIVAAILPASFIEGTLYLVLYALGLSLALFVLAFAGQRLITRLGWALNPHGVFRQIIGLLFVIVGLLVMTGGDKLIQTSLLESGIYDPIKTVEQSLR